MVLAGQWNQIYLPLALTFPTVQSLCCAESDLLSLKVTFNRKRPPGKSISWDLNWIFSCSVVSLSSKYIRYLLNRDQRGKWVVRELGWLGKLLRTPTHFVIVREATERSFDITSMWHALLNRSQQRCGTKCSHRGQMKSIIICTQNEKAATLATCCLSAKLKVNNSNKQANTLGYGSETQAKIACYKVNYNKWAQFEFLFLYLSVFEEPWINKCMMFNKDS